MAKTPLQHSIKRGRLTKGEDDAQEDGILSPLYEEGEKGGNPESPEAEGLPDFMPRDPMGFLPRGSREK
jgi:hypothetical protein